MSRYIGDKIFVKIRSVLPEMWAELWKNALSRNVEESFKSFMHPDLEADDSKILISSSLLTDTSVVKFSWRSFQQFLRQVVNRQRYRHTHRKTDKRGALHNLLGGGDEFYHSNESIRWISDCSHKSPSFVISESSADLPSQITKCRALSLRERIFLITADDYWVA